MSVKKVSVEIKSHFEGIVSIIRFSGTRRLHLHSWSAYLPLFY